MIFAESERSFEGELPCWGWAVPVKTEPTPPGLIMDNKLVLRTHLWLMKVRACVPHACTALCTVEWASVVWKGVILCGLCSAGEEQVCSPCLPFMMCLTLQLSSSLEICCRS